MKVNIQEITKEALLINKRLKKDKERLDEIKKIILEDSQGKNTSYKIETDLGEAKVTKYKDKLTYRFNENSFKYLDEKTKEKLIEDNIVEKQIYYSLNYEKF